MAEVEAVEAAILWRFIILFGASVSSGNFQKLRKLIFKIFFMAAVAVTARTTRAQWGSFLKLFALMLFWTKFILVACTELDTLVFG